MTKANLSDSNRIGKQSHIRWVAIRDMRTSPHAQREYRRSHAEKLAADFKLEALGYPVLNYRDDHWWVVDGQHRIAALKLTGWGDQQIECEVFDGPNSLNEAGEAELFLERNDRRNITGFDKFKVALVAEREVETDIERTVLTQGLKISNHATEGSVGAVGALHKVYSLGGPVVLGRTLRIIRDAYGGHPKAFEANLITGLGMVCQRYNGLLEDDRAIQALARVPGGALGLLGKAETTRRSTGRQKSHCVAATVIEVVNAGRGGKKLEPWWK